MHQVVPTLALTGIHYTLSHSQAYTLKHTHTCTHTLTYIHAYTYIHTYIHTHKYTQITQTIPSNRNNAVNEQNVYGAEGNSAPVHWPIVIGAQFDEGTAKEHHTDHFKMDDLAVAIRRGQKFTVTVDVDSELSHHHAILMRAEGHSIKFETLGMNENTERDDDNAYDVTFSTHASETAVGKITSLEITVVGVDPYREYDTFEYNFPFTVYMLFNPWCKEVKIYNITKEKILLFG